MAISTTSQQIIIYQKVIKKSKELIHIEKESKDSDNQDSSLQKSKSQIHNTINYSSNTKEKMKTLKKKTKKKDRSNINIYSFNRNNQQFNLNDSVEIKKKNSSSRSRASVESDDPINNKIYKEKNEDDDYFAKLGKNSLFKISNFDKKTNYKLDRINFGSLNSYNAFNNESFDSLYNNTTFYAGQSRMKEYDYTWEKIFSLFIDGPALRLQWATSEFGNILACSGYNKCVYILKEEKWRNKANWKCSSQIKEFTDSVEDISFVPRNHSLLLATLSSDGFLKIFNPLNNETNWQLKQSLNISKNGCTCLCCNPSTLDKLTIVIGCKKSVSMDEIKNEKNNSKEETNPLGLNEQENIKTKINGLIKILYFLDINTPIKGTINEYGHEDDITDVDWANQNGRTYHMICSTSKDGVFIIWEIILFLEEKNNDEINNNSNFFSYKKIFEYRHPKPLWRCSFNESGLMASCVDENGEVMVFYKIGRNKFIKLDIHKQRYI